MKWTRASATEISTGKLVPTVHKQPLKSSAVTNWDGIIIEQHRLAPSESPEISLHHHSISIMLGLEYQIDWRLAGGKFQTSRMRGGEIGFTPKDIPTQARWFQDVEFLLISLDDSLIQKAVADVTDCSNISFIPQRGVPDAQIFHLGMALFGELEAQCPTGKMFVDSIASAFAAHLVTHYSHKRALPTHTTNVTQQQLRSVIDYITDNLEFDLSLAELAALADMSPYSFIRWFKSALGVTPHQYIIEQRMELAKFLLSHTHLPIVEIALRAGCSSQSNFTVLFRKQVGITPKAYREAT